MDLSVFGRGLAVGFAIAAPVGPIGVLCINRTLTYGRLAGLLSGLGAATADAIYGVVAGFGLTIISAILVEQNFWFRLIGGIFLIYLGIRTFISKPTEAATVNEPQGLFKVYASTVFLTLTNPTTILAFGFIFAGLGLAAAEGDHVAAIWTVLGVFLGSAAWWLLLSSGVSLLQTRLTAGHLRWLNRGSGIILVAFGIIALFSFAQG